MAVRMWLGLVVMVLVITFGILIGSSLLPFVHPPALIIVLGVLFGGLIWSFPAGEIAAVLQEMLTKVELTEERALAGHAFFSRAADLAIGAGLVGTLIGLTQMLQSLEDPTTIGPAMAMALLTLLYGVIIGELFCRSAATDCLSRANLTSEVRRRRGFASLYAVMAMLFMAMLCMFMMLVAMAPW